MNKYIMKSLFRSLKSSMGRYLSIFAIIALGVGFFAGLKNCRPAMVSSADGYFEKYNLYDLRVISTLGLDKDDINDFSELSEFKDIEGAYSETLYISSQKASGVFTVSTLTNTVNLPQLLYGQMPSAKDECIVDASVFGEDDIGKTIAITDENSEESLNSFSEKTYKITGIAASPEYISSDRGTTSLGDGSVMGYIYVHPDSYTGDVFSVIYLTFSEKFDLYSDEYDEFSETASQKAELVLEECAQRRKNELVDALAPILGQEAAEEIIGEPTLYVLNRDSNTGVALYENDTAIVSSIANVFPVFFVLIAVLVCMTTMSRMVNDERTQIGTLKALGCGNVSIAMKYILYSSSSALFGCLAGFFLGTYIMPKVIWTIYQARYTLPDPNYDFDTLMFFMCIIASLVCSVGVTSYSCFRDLHEKPAELIRPKSPKAGKKIFLEKIGVVWKRLSFLNKVCLRNTFRYKKRMFMMLVGICGCTALLVTGFGLKDSIANVVNDQYDEIFNYNLSVSVNDSATQEDIDRISQIWRDDSEQYVFVYQEQSDIVSSSASKSAYVVAFEKNSLENFVYLHNGGEAIAYPEGNNAVITEKLAENLSVEVGDSITVKDRQYTVSGICDNYINNYVYIENTDTEVFPLNRAYITVKSDADMGKLSASIRQDSSCSSVYELETERRQINDALSSMDYIVAVVILCSGALAFIVLYNLTNINIIERQREIATVKVLGFNRMEASSYVLRDNIILSVIGGIVGLPLGKLLHFYVMSQIQVDMINFDMRISVWSYVFAISLTLIFTLVSNFFMNFKINKINMSESLKSIE